MLLADPLNDALDLRLRLINDLNEHFDNLTVLLDNIAHLNERTVTKADNLIGHHTKEGFLDLFTEVLLLNVKVLSQGVDLIALRGLSWEKRGFNFGGSHLIKVDNFDQNGLSNTESAGC